MATIRIKRGLEENLPTGGYVAGELFLTTDTGKLYIAYADDRPLKEIANLESVLKVAQNLNDVGDKSTARTNLGVYSKDEVDALIDGRVYVNVDAATTGNITLSGEQNIDGFSATTGDRILVKNQTTASQNGIYVVASGAWNRSTDADTGTEVAKLAVIVDGGTDNGQTVFICTSKDITLGTDPVEFIQLPTGANYTQGEGIEISGNSINLGFHRLNELTISDDVSDVLAIYDISTNTHKYISKATLLSDVTSVLNKVKFDSGDPTAGYLADKVIGSTGISAAEGTSGNANKIQIAFVFSDFTSVSSVNANTDEILVKPSLSLLPHRITVNDMLNSATIDGGSFDA